MCHLTGSGKPFNSGMDTCQETARRPLPRGHSKRRRRGYPAVVEIAGRQRGGNPAAVYRPAPDQKGSPRTDAEGSGGLQEEAFRLNFAPKARSGHPWSPRQPQNPLLGAAPAGQRHRGGPTSAGRSNYGARPRCVTRPASISAVPSAVLSMNHIRGSAWHRATPASSPHACASTARDLRPPS